MRHALQQWWLGLSRRERMATLAASAFALIAALYLVALEPAWRTRARLGAELPVLRAQAAEVEALGLEARRLKQHAVRFENAGELRAAAAKLLAERNLAATLQAGDGERLVLAARRVDAANCLAALKDVSSALPLRIVAARITRVAAGMVDAEVTLAPVGK
ncbi:MAG TPA: type II secretion system protein GspM [Burkholderiales bacterium]|nr:type II secretion system protein GspM [Burkholderiales bacterium]